MSFSENPRYRCAKCGGLLVPPNPLIGVYSAHCPAHPRADIIAHAVAPPVEPAIRDGNGQLRLDFK